MVNLIMRVNAGDETATMSRSFLLKKYSHCPLKKRPVQFVKEENNFDDEGTLELTSLYFYYLNNKFFFFFLVKKKNTFIVRVVWISRN